MTESDNGAGGSPQEEQDATPLDYDRQVQETRPDPLTTKRYAELFGVGFALAAFFWVVRRLPIGRRTPPTPAERLSASTKKATERAVPVLAAGAGVVAREGRRAGARAGDLGGDAAKRAGERAGELGGEAAKRAGELGSEAAKRAAVLGGVAAAKASELGTEAAKKAGELGGEAAKKAGELGGEAVKVGAKVGSALAEVPDEIGDTLGSVQKKVRKTRRRLFVVVCLAIGYVLGARAGRERYDQIMRLAGQVADRPEVQPLKDKVAPSRPPAQPGGSTGAPTGGTGGSAGGAGSPDAPSAPPVS